MQEKDLATAHSPGFMFNEMGKRRERLDQLYKELLWSIKAVEQLTITKGPYSIIFPHLSRSCQVLEDIEALASGAPL